MSGRCQGVRRFRFGVLAKISEDLGHKPAAVILPREVLHCMVYRAKRPWALTKNWGGWQDYSTVDKPRFMGEYKAKRDFGEGEIC
ncbi:MAG: hypothetical protein QME78_02910 [Thermodesulfobacteriota bacterium]|nr:hypothetical protein [Thermodesulfobacteriota bacterium]